MFGCKDTCQSEVRGHTLSRSVRQGFFRQNCSLWGHRQVHVVVRLVSPAKGRMDGQSDQKVQ